MKYETINPTLYPDAQMFLDSLANQGGPQIYELPVADARKVLDQAQSGAIEKLPADIEDITIPTGPYGSISIRIVRPNGSSSVIPVVLYFHGGGWVLGNKDTHDRLVREIAVGADVAVAFVNYTPSPEAQNSTTVEECYAATDWIANNGSAHNLDGKKLAVAGDSAGGQLAIAVTMLAKERSGPTISCQVLFYPVTDSSFDTTSYLQFATGYFLTREAMRWFWSNYAPHMESRRKLTLSPLQSEPEQLTGLPSALIITGEADVLRDEGEAYARKLLEAGVEVTAVRYIGIIHDFVMLNAVANTPAARSAISLATAFLRKALTT